MAKNKKAASSSAAPQWLTRRGYRTAMMLPLSSAWNSQSNFRPAGGDETETCRPGPFGRRPAYLRKYGSPFSSVTV